MSTPWAAITATADTRPAQPVGVWGAGGLGVHAVQLLRMIGAARIIAVDPLPAARERALEFGADAAFDPADETVAQLVALTRRRRLDLSRSASAVVPLADAAQAVKRLQRKDGIPSG